MSIYNYIQTGLKAILNATYLIKTAFPVAVNDVLIEKVHTLAINIVIFAFYDYRLDDQKRCF